MPGYFYVKNGLGTRTTGGPLTIQTGAFGSTGLEAADVYATITAAMADGSQVPVAGDFVLCSDAHTFTSTSQVSVTPAAAQNTPVIIMSVDDTSAGVYKAGADEAATGGTTDIQTALAGAKAHLIGIDLSTDDDISAAQTGSSLTIENSTLTFTGTGDTLNVTGAGAFLAVRNSTLVWTVGSTSGCIAALSAGVKADLSNCIFSVGSNALDDLTRSGTGGTLRVDNCDLTLLAGYMLGVFGADSVNDDNYDMRMSNCRVHSNVVDGTTGFVEENFESAGQYFLATNCSDTIAEAEYQFYQQTMAGTVRDSGDDGTAGNIYRTGSTAFTGTNKVSFKCVTRSNCAEGNALTFDMPARYADLTSTSTDAIKVYITQAASQANLTTANTWVEVSYPDGTNKHLWNTKSSRAADILSATELATNSEVWNDGATSPWATAHDKYEIVVDTASDAGAECVPHVKIFCIVPSITFYVDTTIDITAVA